MVGGRACALATAAPALAASAAEPWPTAPLALASLAAGAAGLAPISAGLAVAAAAGAGPSAGGVAAAGVVVVLLACAARARPGAALVAAVSILAWSWAVAFTSAISTADPPPGLEWLRSPGGAAVAWLLASTAAAAAAYDALAPPRAAWRLLDPLSRSVASYARLYTNDPSLAGRILIYTLTLAPALADATLLLPAAAGAAARVQLARSGVKGPATLTLAYTLAYSAAAWALGLTDDYQAALDELTAPLAAG